MIKFYGIGEKRQTFSSLLGPKKKFVFKSNVQILCTKVWYYFGKANTHKVKVFLGDFLGLVKVS